MLKVAVRVSVIVIMISIINNYDINNNDNDDKSLTKKIPKTLSLQGCSQISGQDEALEGSGGMPPRKL